MKLPLKVAHILVPYIQPTETFIYDRIINHHRYKPFVLTDEQPVNTDIFPFSPIYSLSQRPFHIRQMNTLANKLFGFSTYFHQMLKKEDPAIVHAHYGPVGATIAPAARAVGKPLVVSFYGIDASAFLKNARHSVSYKRLFDQAAVISVLSQDMADRMEEAGCHKDRLQIHHLAVNVDTLKPSRNTPENDSFRIVSVGRFVPKKGMGHLVAAFEMLLAEYPAAELHLYGKGPLEEKVRGLIARRNLNDKVVMYGHQDRATVLDAIRNAHVFALFSVTGPDGDKEGTPTVLIEAGALGVSSVSTHHAGIPEIVEDGHTGYLVDEHDEEGFAEKLLYLVRHPEIRTSMSRAARARIEAEFEIRAVMAKIEKSYDELL